MYGWGDSLISWSCAWLCNNSKWCVCFSPSSCTVLLLCLLTMTLCTTAWMGAYADIHVQHSLSLNLQAGTHPNIVSLLGMTTQGGPTCLLLEYMPHGTLNWFLWSLKKGPTPAWYLHFVKDTLRGRYHKHVSGDLMSILIQVAEGMVSDIPHYHNVSLNPRPRPAFHHLLCSIVGRAWERG